MGFKPKEFLVVALLVLGVPAAAVGLLLVAARWFSPLSGIYVSFAILALIMAGAAVHCFILMLSVRILGRWRIFCALLVAIAVPAICGYLLPGSVFGMASLLSDVQEACGRSASISNFDTALPCAAKVYIAFAVFVFAQWILPITALRAVLLLSRRHVSGGASGG